MLPTSRAILWVSLLPNLAIIPPPSVSSKQSPDYHNRDLSALAKLALAGVYRDTNRTSDAVNLYKQLMEKPSPTGSLERGAPPSRIERAAVIMAKLHEHEIARHMFASTLSHRPSV